MLGALVFIAMHIAFTRQLDAMIAGETRTLVDEYHADGPGELGEAIAEREASRSPQRLMYAVFAPDGRRLYGSSRRAVRRLACTTCSSSTREKVPTPGAAWPSTSRRRTIIGGRR